MKNINSGKVEAGTILLNLLQGKNTHLRGEEILKNKDVLKRKSGGISYMKGNGFVEKNIESSKSSYAKSTDLALRSFSSDACNLNIHTLAENRRSDSPGTRSDLNESANLFITPIRQNNRESTGSTSVGSSVNSRGFAIPMFMRSPNPENVPIPCGFGVMSYVGS